VKVIHFQYGMATGILTAAMVISRRLNHIVKITSVSPTKVDQRRVILVDLALGLTVPIISMGWGKHSTRLTTQNL
jgi:pheromone a factor receptor